MDGLPCTFDADHAFQDATRRPMPASTPARFPPLAHADEDGLLMIGGQLGTDWLLAAYRRAIFPWPILHRGVEILAWFSPDPRAVLEFDDLHVSRRLLRRIRRQEFQVTCNRDFAAVIRACAEPRPDPFGGGTWITPAIQDAYLSLHNLGYAHSVEVWQEGELAGGVYGVALGGLFAGESMFYRRRDASKVALVYLVAHLRVRGYELFDVQQATAHTQRMGASQISRRDYCRRLQRVLQLPVTFGDHLQVDIDSFTHDVQRHA